MKKMQQRPRFFKLCEKMTQYRWRALFVEASYEDVKSPYGEYTLAHPYAVSGTLDALEAKYGIPVSGLSGGESSKLVVKAFYLLVFRFEWFGKVITGRGFVIVYSGQL